MENWEISTILSPSNPIVIVLSVAAIGVSMWTFITIDPKTKPGIRFGLAGLRLITVFYGIYLLMQPNLIVTKSTPQPTPVAVLFDASASMGYPKDNTRLNEAIQATKTALQKQNKSGGWKTHFFSYAKTVLSYADIDDVALHQDEKNETNLRNALLHLNKLQEDVPFAGVVLLSDGADTSSNATATAKQLGLPINSVFIDSENLFKDALVKEIVVDDFAFSRKPNPIHVVVKNHGLSVTNLKVNLLKNGKLVQQKHTDIIDGTGQTTFEVVPKHPGHHVYTVAIPVHPEERYTTNNTRHVELNVVRDKYRVLHLSGAPSWDQRFTRDFLTQWPQIDLVSFYLLRTPYQSTTQSTSGLSLIPFPTEQLFTQHLREFDIIIFQNFDPATVGVDQYLDEITTYVKDGGALIISGGINGLTAPSIANSALAKILPVAFPRANLPPTKLASDAPFSPILTEQGRRHPLFHFAPTGPSSEEALRSLPRLSGMVKVKKMNKEGVALLTHPVLHVENDAAPLVAISEPNNGRIMVVATDSLWNWGFTAALTGAPSRFYNEFWKKSVRWLTRSPDLARLSIEMDDSTKTQGKPIQFTITMQNMEYLPAAGESLKIAISWTDDTETERSKTITGITNNVGQFQHSWSPTGHGPHRITAASKTHNLHATKTFLVSDPNIEMNHLTPDVQPLKRISELTNGAFFSGSFQLSKLALNTVPRNKILSRHDFSLWSHPITLLLLLALLIADWSFRKWRGIL